MNQRRKRSRPRTNGVTNATGSFKPPKGTCGFEFQANGGTWAAIRLLDIANPHAKRLHCKLQLRRIGRVIVHYENLEVRKVCDRTEFSVAGMYVSVL